MSAVSFEKYEGLGNDFIVLDAPGVALSDEEVARLCDRRRGVGADGVLFVTEAHGRRAMRIVNADGSHAEMCGNGLRCVVFHLARRGVIEVGSLVTIDTDAGPHEARVLQASEREGDVWVSMRAASLAPRDVPHTHEAALRDHLVELDGRALHVTAISMGNPHAVLFDDVGDARLALGPKIQRLPLFPNLANVGFARLVEGEARPVIELHVYERGAGWTEACGTGACAAVVAAIETGRLARGEPTLVRLPGGALEITASGAKERIGMRGPARHTFSGRVAQPRPR